MWQRYSSPAGMPASGSSARGSSPPEGSTSYLPAVARRRCSRSPTSCGRRTTSTWPQSKSTSRRWSRCAVRRPAALHRSSAARSKLPHALICNAGGRFDGQVKYSPEGYELTFATNCLGHFLLVELLLSDWCPPTVASCSRPAAHTTPTLWTASWSERPPSRTPMRSPTSARMAEKSLSVGKRYSTSKLCTVMYAYELARRLDRAGSSIASIAYDPGSVPETGLSRNLPKVVQYVAKSSLMEWVSRRVGITTSTLAFSGAALAELAVDPQYASGSGKYFQAQDGELSEVRSSTMSYDEQRALALWNDSKRLVGLG